MITFCIFIALSHFPAKADILRPATDDNSFVIVVFRHGFRNPIKFIPNVVSLQKGKWGTEGAGLLTNLGKRQGYELGRFLKQMYGPMVSEIYKPDQIKALSSSSDRCQMTMLTVLASLYRPNDNKTKFVHDLNWQPIPYSVDDNMLRVFESSCPKYLKIHEPFLTDDIAAARLYKKGKEPLINYISENTGFSGTLLNLSHVADNVIAMRQNNASFPDWLEDRNLPNYPRKNKLIAEVVKFAASSPILCALNETCARPLAGVFLNEIFQQLVDKVSGKLPNRFMNLYSTHIEGVLPTLRFMGANVSDVAVGGGYILELLKKGTSSKTEYTVRLILIEPNVEPSKSYQAKLTPLFLQNISSNGTAATSHNVSDFLDQIRPYRIENFTAYCNDL